MIMAKNRFEQSKALRRSRERAKEIKRLGSLDIFFCLKLDGDNFRGKPGKSVPFGSARQYDTRYAAVMAAEGDSTVERIVKVVVMPGHELIEKSFPPSKEFWREGA
jgi:hypothetical protein